MSVKSLILGLGHIWRQPSANAQSKTCTGTRVPTTNNAMKKLLTLIIAGVCATAVAQTTTTTTTTTMGTGTVTEYTPGSTLVLKETTGPVTYRYGETVSYVTRSGRTLTAEEAQTRIRVGSPISVSYSTDGDARVVDRIEIDDGEVEIDRD